MQHTFARPAPPKPISIDVGGEPQGVVIPLAEGYRFMAVRLGVFPLDGKLFTSVEEARDAAADAIEKTADE